MMDVTATDKGWFLKMGLLEMRISFNYGGRGVFHLPRPQVPLEINLLRSTSSAAPLGEVLSV